MENKTTTELLELLHKKGTSSDKNYDEDIYQEALAELIKRSPFWEILDEDWEEGLPTAWETIKELQEEVRLLKRHKHEQRSGDVMIRI
ncbi:hypothetical protein LCGC14_2194100 [marine sediment metagenome]|uniref:Uncharacterized protein n=1 Tax=marine sediment metagenome TaxID=412755 RepID=A0A0F9DIP4_9ZZZZ